MNFFSKIIDSIVNAFKHVSAEAKKYIAISLEITGSILKVVTNKGGDALLYIISPEMEAEIPNIKKYLADAIIILTSASDVASATQGEGESNDAFLQRVLFILLDELDKFNLFASHALLAKLASILLGLLDGNTQPEHVYDTHIQNAVAVSKR